MTPNQPTLLYLLIFLALSIVLKLFGIIDVTIVELFGYTSIFYGITLVYSSFGKKQLGVLFIGSSLFLTGLLIFLTNNFEFSNNNEIIFPAVLLIIGIDFLMLFLDNMERLSFIAISLTTIFSAIVVILLLGDMTFRGFFLSVINLVEKYWPIVVIAVGLILFLNFSYKKIP
ncbi:MAG TPA: hypothetical protein VLN45_07320 [Ignavibacteriaceae bacterium]|nr:hypothetical protein [Ignavibacteriaceae bacterium]